VEADQRNTKKEKSSKKKPDKQPPQTVELHHLPAEEGQQGRIPLEDMRSHTRHSYAQAVKQTPSISPSLLDEDPGMGGVEHIDHAMPDMEKFQELAPARPPKIPPKPTFTRQDDEDGDGGDLALLSGYTTIEHGDPVFRDADDSMQESATQRAVTHELVFGSMNTDGLFGEGPLLGLVQLPPRPQHEPESSYDVDMMRRGADREMLLEKEREMQMRIEELTKEMQMELEQLAKEVQDLGDKKDIAEGKNELLMRQMQDMKRMMPSLLEDVDKDSDSLAQAFTNLQHENRILREQLQDAQSHIFSLQPYRKDLTPEEVGRVGRWMAAT
jgi:hypothetical protein